VHLSGAGQGAGPDQHGDGRSWHASLHGKCPDEEHGHAVLDEELGQRRHAQEAEVMTDAVMSVI